MSYQWQGEPVKVRFGYVHQVENKEKPLYWYNFDCYNKQELDGSWITDHMVGRDGLHFSLIPAIEVTQNGNSFLIANHYGIGIRKLKNGGWPNFRHSSLDGNFHECHRQEYYIKEFDEEGLNNYDSARIKWQKKEYPEESSRLEKLRLGFKHPHLLNK